MSSTVALFHVAAASLFLSPVLLSQTVPAIEVVPSCVTSSERRALEQRRAAIEAERDRLRAAITTHDRSCQNIPEKSDQARLCSAEGSRLTSEKDRHIQATRAFNREAAAASDRCDPGRPMLVAQIEGQAFLEAGPLRTPLRPGDTIKPGARVFTGANSRVSLMMTSGERIDVGSNATFEFVEAEHDLVSLLRGAMHILHNCLAGDPGCHERPRRVRTPVAVAAVRGTEFVVESGSSGAAISVFSGVVEVAGVSPEGAVRGTPVEIGAGKRIRVDQTGTPGTPETFAAASISAWWK